MIGGFQRSAVTYFGYPVWRSSTTRPSGNRELFQKSAELGKMVTDLRIRSSKNYVSDLFLCEGDNENCYFINLFNALKIKSLAFFKDIFWGIVLKFIQIVLWFLTLSFYNKKARTVYIAVWLRKLGMHRIPFWPDTGIRLIKEDTGDPARFSAQNWNFF
jgi:hypothetical protein